MSCLCVNCGNFRKMKAIKVKDIYTLTGKIPCMRNGFGMEKLHLVQVYPIKELELIKPVCDGNEDDHLTNMFNNVEDCYVDRPDELSKML